MSRLNRCFIHGDDLIWEPGGVDMATMLGRHYCQTCEDEFTAALDALEVDE